VSKKAGKPALEDAYPMSMLQQGMIFHSLQQPDLSIYHDVTLYRFNVNWDEAKFRQALNHLLKKHAILRTVFNLDQGRPLQFVMKCSEARFDIVNLANFRQNDKEARLGMWLDEEKANGVDLSSFPWKICVFILAPEEIAFGMSFHHALWDGWSNASFISELLTAYNSLREQENIPPSKAPPPYKYFIAL